MKIAGEFIKYLKRPENGGSGFALVNYESTGGFQPAKVGGPFPQDMKPGDWFAAEGHWRSGIHDGKKEATFSAHAVFPGLPETSGGVKAYLGRYFSNDRHGITREAIEEFAKTQGAFALIRAERKPEMLAAISTNPPLLGSIITEDWKKLTASREGIRLMEDAKFPPKTILSVLKAFSGRATELIKTNPYELIKLGDVSFEMADRIGLNLGIAKNDRRRADAALRSIVMTNGDNGHTCTPIRQLFEGLRPHEIDTEVIKRLIDFDPLREGVVFSHRNGETILAHKDRHYRSEVAISTRITTLITNGRMESKDHIDRHAETVLASKKYAHFDDIQKQAVLTSARERVAILTGGPGTGKSTVTEAIAEIAAATSNGPVILVAPTGKAALRLEETTSKAASTVHKALGAKGDEMSPRFDFNKMNKLPAGCFVIIDEASMLDVEITAALLEAVPDDGKVLFVGDRHQLPSVGAGYVLGDLIAAVAENGTRVPCSELINVYRQDKKSKIATMAQDIRTGQFQASSVTNVMEGGVIMYEVEDEGITDKIVRLVTKAIPKSLGAQPHEIAVLSPQREKRGGTNELNMALSRALNPKGREIPEMPNPGNGMPKLRVGDRVMMTRNDYDNQVMNGDIGTITGSYRDGKSNVPRTMVQVEFESGQKVEYPAGRCRDLILAYAITGHKSQGSQYKCVVMPCAKAHSKMLDRTLVYTEMTRSKEFLILVGDKNTLDAAVANTDSSNRVTSLKGMLAADLMSVPQIVAAPSSPGEFVPPQVRAPASRAPVPSIRPPVTRPTASPSPRSGVVPPPVRKGKIPVPVPKSEEDEPSPGMRM